MTTAEITSQITYYNDPMNRDHFRAMGLIPLTGESDGTSIGRILYDVMPYGISLIEEYFGRTIRVEEKTNHNYSDGQVASIMLTHSTAHELFIYYLITRVHEIVVHVPYERHEGWAIAEQIMGMTREVWDQYRAEYPDFGAKYPHARVYWTWENSIRGRMQHFFSGRIE